MNKLLKISLTVTAIVLFAQASVYLFINKEKVSELAIRPIITFGNYKTVRLSEVQKNTQPVFWGATQKKVTTRHVAKENCPFNAGPSAHFHKLAIFSQIAWMGSLNKSTDEWIELRAASTSVRGVNVSDWQILNRSGRIKIFIPKGIILNKDNPFYLLKRGIDYSGALKNSSEALKLFDNNCNLVDEVFANPNWPAGNNEKKLPMKRADDLSWYHEENDQIPMTNNQSNPNNQVKIDEPLVIPNSNLKSATSQSQRQVETSLTITTKNKGSKSTSETLLDQKSNIVSRTSFEIVIYEIQAGTEASSKDEFVKLYNPNNQAVDLKGWALKKKTKSGKEYNLVSNQKFKGIIQPKQYFIIAHKEYGGVSDLIYSANSNQLAYSNNSVLLYDHNKKLINEVTYPKINKGQVWKAR